MKAYIQPDKHSKFVAPIRTSHYRKIWQCANVPYKVEFNNGVNIKLLPFNGKSSVNILNNNFENDFYHLESDDTYVYAPNYPNGKILISEFYVKPISIQKLKKHFKGNNILNIIEKAKQDSFNSKGNQFCITIKKYNKYKNNPKTSKLERIGDPIFNRSVRHSPPISKTFTRENFEKSLSYPAPIGIREEDFALPSEQNKILIDLLNQIFSCKNAPDCPQDIQNELTLTINKNTHTCLWCGEVIDLLEINQEYCSKEHSINFCHRIPELGTKTGNVYIGHCSCNREQGGYSEEQRIEQFCRLASIYNNLSYREKIFETFYNDFIMIVKDNPSYKEKILQELA